MAALAILAISLQARADVYSVDSSFNEGTTNATLTGTVSLPEGSFVITNGGSSPFTAINLTLTVDGTPYDLTKVYTLNILGTGEFFIDATAATLTFNTAGGGFTDPADLEFSDNSNPRDNDWYIIGYDGAPGFQSCSTGAGSPHELLALPYVFGTAVPEPTTLALAGLAVTLLTLRGLARQGPFPP